MKSAPFKATVFAFYRPNVLNDVGGESNYRGKVLYLQLSSLNLIGVVVVVVVKVVAIE